MYIGEGMTRFLALFYGEYAQGRTTAEQQAAQDAQIGPIRSGRLPYESVRQLYNGFLVMSGAYSAVAQQLHSASTVWNQTDDINGTGISLSNLQTMAAGQKVNAPNETALSGLQFDTAVPDGGQDANKLSIFYNYLNQVEWTYDPASGAYLRAQDISDGSGNFYPATDKLTGQQLGFNNVVILFANHVAKAPTMIDIELVGIKNYPALLFRDGKVYKTTWSTLAPIRPIQMKDANGQVVSYKPGNTWFEIVTRYSTAKSPEPGNWKVRFYNP